MRHELRLNRTTGAGRGVRVMLMKRFDQTQEQPMDTIEKALKMSERELIKLAKTDAITKAELSQLIDEKAQERRESGESREIAYTKFITNDPLGRDLYQVMKSAPGLDHHQHAAFERATKSTPKAQPKPEDDMSPDERIALLAEEHR